MNAATGAATFVAAVLGYALTRRDALLWAELGGTQACCSPREALSSHCSQAARNAVRTLVQGVGCSLCISSHKRAALLRMHRALSVHC